MSTVIHPDSTGIVRSVAGVTTPVRPIPPTVAQKSSGSWSGPIVWVVAVGGDQVGGDDVGAEGPGAVVALAVHVAGDRTARR